MREKMTMTNRITKTTVDHYVKILNKRIGFPEDTPRNTPGLIVIGSAYNGYKVEQMINVDGGITTLMHAYGTRREVVTFLEGMLAMCEAKDNLERVNK